jgi:hypothetical protein
MAHLVPDTLPDTLRAGDTATWRRTLADYPATDGWSLSYVLVKTGAQITIAAAADGLAHLVTVAVGTTAAWAPGRYTWQERVSKSGATYTTGAGMVEILASFAAATSGLDARNHAEKTLAALEAWIEGHDLSVAEYQIAGRSMKYIAIADLLKLRDTYRREVRGQSGKSGRVYLRF